MLSANEPTYESGSFTPNKRPTTTAKVANKLRSYVSTCTGQLAAIYQILCTQTCRREYLQLE
jgi:hypothetical protein